MALDLPVGWHGNGSPACVIIVRAVELLRGSLCHVMERLAEYTHAPRSLFSGDMLMNSRKVLQSRLRKSFCTGVFWAFSVGQIAINVMRALISLNEPLKGTLYLLQRFGPVLFKAYKFQNEVVPRCFLYSQDSRKYVAAGPSNNAAPLR